MGRGLDQRHPAASAPRCYRPRRSASAHGVAQHRGHTATPTRSILSKQVEQVRPAQPPGR